MSQPAADHAWLSEQLFRQLEFGRAFPHPEGGAAWLDSDGRPDLGRPVHTWITARMAHVYSLGALAGFEEGAALAEQALAGLAGRLHDGEHGGWFASVGPGQDLDPTKAAYAHAFVVLAAATGSVAGVPGARSLLDEAVDVLDGHFLDPRSGLYVDRWDRTWSRLDPYRGVNANMHAVEACLAAADATGDRRFLRRAATITERVVHGWAPAHDWRVPEHFDPDWRVLHDHHRDRPDHPFEPYGVTVGHGLEWSRLVLELRAALEAGPGAGPGSAPGWMLPAAEALFDRAVADGWAVDGAEGFVYTTDWDGRPVVRDRMHWVVAEAICAAAALHRATGREEYAAFHRRWWEHAVQFWVHPENGSWQHQLGPDLAPRETVWPGRPDLYHSVHAVLLPRLPLHPGAARALVGPAAP